MRRAEVISGIPAETTQIEVIRITPLMDMSKEACLARIAFSTARGIDMDGGIVPQHEITVDDHILTCVPTAARRGEAR